MADKSSIEAVAESPHVISTSVKVIQAVMYSIAAGIIIYFATWAADKVPKYGVTTTDTPIQVTSWISTLIQTVLGIDASNITLESLVLYLAIFAIVFFAISDIMEMFSTFSTTTAWVIGFALALIAGVLKVYPMIAGFFGIAAGIGALGILIIIAGAIVAAVTLNLGIGGTVRKWRAQRQMEIEGLKAYKGGRRVTDAIAGLKEIETGLAAGEK